MGLSNSREVSNAKQYSRRLGLEVKFTFFVEKELIESFLTHSRSREVSFSPVQ
jgi:hypothetical protein